MANEDIILFKRTPIKREDGAEVDADEIGQMIMDYDVSSKSNIAAPLLCYGR